MTLEELRNGARAVLTATETGALLGISPRTVHRLQDAGQLPELWLGRKRVMPVPALLELLGAGPETPNPPHHAAGDVGLTDTHDRWFKRPGTSGPGRSVQRAGPSKAERPAEGDRALEHSYVTAPRQGDLGRGER